MNLFETLQEFKKIGPDASFTEKSKRAILATRQNVPHMSPFRGVLQFIETGAAVVLAGFFILLITGAFSNSPYIAPVQFSVIDPAGLHAEAQAIDVQIQLAHVSYVEGSTSSIPAAAPFATPSLRTALTTSMAATSTASTSATAVSASASTTATSTPITVDQALNQLEK